MFGTFAKHSENVRTHPNASENFRKRSKTLKKSRNIAKIRENARAHAGPSIVNALGRVLLQNNEHTTI